MSAAPPDPPAADGPTASPTADGSTASPPPAPSSFADPLVRLGRLVDQRNLLTIGGWGLFAASTVFAATLTAPGPAAPAAVVERDEVRPPAKPSPPLAARPPVRVAALPGAAPLRRWPSPPEGYLPPPPESRDACTSFPTELKDFCLEPPETADPPRRESRPESLPGSSDVWRDFLADLPPAVADDLTAMREQFGSVVPFAPSAATPAPLPAPVNVAPARPVVKAVAHPEWRAALAAARMNLAGAFTPGFQRVEPTGAADGLRVEPTPGPLRDTGRPLDLALIGKGWFAAVGDGPTMLTRAGSFLVRDGRLVFALDPTRRVRGSHGEPIAVADDLFNLRFDAWGQLHADHAVEEDVGVIGTVAVVAPAEAAAVELLGGAWYRTAEPVFVLKDAPTAGGFQEDSNVDVTAEIAGFDLARAVLERLSAVDPGEEPACLFEKPDSAR